MFNTPQAHTLYNNNPGIGYLPISFNLPVTSNMDLYTTSPSILETSTTGNGNYAMSCDPVNNSYGVTGTLTGLSAGEYWSNIGLMLITVSPSTNSIGRIAIATGLTNKYAYYGVPLVTGWTTSTFGAIYDNWRVSHSTMINRTLSSADNIVLVSGDTNTIYSINQGTWLSASTGGFNCIDSRYSTSVIVDKFIATKSSGDIYYSPNGIGWILSASSALGTLSTDCIANDSVTFMIIGEDPSTSNIEMLKGTNGITWTSTILSIPYSNSKLTFSGTHDNTIGSFIILNDTGDFYESDDAGVSWNHGQLPQFFTYCGIAGFDGGLLTKRFFGLTQNSQALCYAYVPYPTF